MKTSTRRFHRTVIQVEVLSEEPYDPHKDLDEIAHDITEGDCNGSVVILSSNQEISGHEAARRLVESGSDPGFFGLTEDGNDIEDN